MCDELATALSSGTFTPEFVRFVNKYACALRSLWFLSGLCSLLAGVAFESRYLIDNDAAAAQRCGIHGVIPEVGYKLDGGQDDMVRMALCCKGKHQSCLVLGLCDQNFAVRGIQ